MKPEQSVVVFTGIGYIEIHFWQLRGHDTHQAHIKQKATELLVVFTERGMLSDGSSDCADTATVASSRERDNISFFISVGFINAKIENICR